VRLCGFINHDEMLWRGRERVDIETWSKAVWF
jgi:hypothetical protein